MVRRYSPDHSAEKNVVCQSRASPAPCSASGPAAGANGWRSRCRWCQRLTGPQMSACAADTTPLSHLPALQRAAVVVDGPKNHLHRDALQGLIARLRHAVLPPQGLRLFAHGFRRGTINHSNPGEGATHRRPALLPRQRLRPPVHLCDNATTFPLRRDSLPQVSLFFLLHPSSNVSPPAPGREHPWIFHSLIFLDLCSG